MESTPPELAGGNTFMSKLNPNIMNELANVELNSLESICRMGSDLSTESLALPFVDTVKSKFNEFVDRSSTFLNGLKVGNYRSNHLDYDAAVIAFNKNPYATNRLVMVHVAPGFTGKWVSFLEYLITNVLPQVEELEATLKKSNTRLAQILNEPDRLAAQSGIKELKGQIPLVSLEVLTKLKQYFTGSNAPEVQASKVIDRNGDMEHAYKLTNTLNDRLAKVDLSSVNGMVGRFADLSTSFKEHLAKHDDTVSGKVGSQLSELFYKLGVTVSAAAALLEIAPQHVEAMKKNISVIEKVGK